jgi:hypothetical protein
MRQTGQIERYFPRCITVSDVDSVDHSPDIRNRVSGPLLIAKAGHEGRIYK